MGKKSLLLTAALLGVCAHASAPEAVPGAINVVVVDETDRGRDRGVLDRHGIASRASRLNRGPHGRALRDILGDPNVRLRLAVPTACPGAATRGACTNIRTVKDVDLPGVIRETRSGTLLVLWPEAAYYEDQQMYAAYLDVDVLEKGKVVSAPFYLGYRDWKCDADCAASAFEASAKELAAMVRYVVEMGPAARTRSVPAAWQSQPAAARTSKWSNACAADVGNHHVVRQYGERLWLNEPGVRTLVSVAWRGCNTVDGL